MKEEEKNPEELAASRKSFVKGLLVLAILEGIVILAVVLLLVFR